MAGYIGNIPTPQATQTRDTFTATASQTTFATSGYTPSFLDVFLNGVHLVNGTDYTASNGSDVVLTSGAAAGDVLEVVAYSTFELFSGTFTGTVTANAFVGDGSALTGIQAGAGYFQGENGATGDTTNGKGDIFRTHESTLNTNVTIASGDNSLAAGPLTVASGVTLTVSGSLAIV